MTQDKSAPAPPDALLARYHAAQAALDALQANGPSEHARTNILDRATKIATESVAAPAIKQRASGLIDTGKPAANDRQWKIRALATVAMFGLTSLLLHQWDRGTPEEKEVAFSAARPAVAERSESAAVPAPAAPAAAPAAGAPPKAEPPSDAVTSKNAAKSQPAVAGDKQGTSDRTTQPKQSANVAVPKMAQSEVPSSAMGTLSKAVPSKSPKEDSAVAKSIAPPATLPTPAAAPAPAAQAPAAITTTPREPAMRAAPAAKAAEYGAAQSMRREDAPSAVARMKKSNAADTESSMQDYSAATAGRTATSPNYALFAAIRSGDAAAVEQALASGADKNAKSSGTPAITLCVQSGKLHLVRRLASAGADLNAPDAQGMLPLAHAQAMGLDAMVGLLLELGAR